ncbi:hypothetical protein [Tissierella sp.]|uniref:hypothetical protein n=1 Tax=Tissierella sp. TaxID=41274 RepID=UPI003048BF6E
MDIKGLYISMTGTVKLKPIKEGYKVFHNNTRAVGIINEDGKKLLEYCNGKNKIEDIIKKVGDEYINDKREIEGMVILGLKHFKWINLVNTMTEEIKDAYKYVIYCSDSSIEVDHGAFHVSEFKESTSELLQKILSFANKGVFQISLICSDFSEKELILNILEQLREQDLIVNLVMRDNIFSQEDIERLKSVFLGRILIELDEEDIRNINSDVRNSEFIKYVRELRSSDIPVEIQLVTNDIEEFSKTIRLCSLIDIKKMYHSYSNIELKESFKKALDDTEKKLFSEYHSIPECIEGNWYDSQDVEEVKYFHAESIGV